MIYKIKNFLGEFPENSKDAALKFARSIKNTDIYLDGELIQETKGGEKVLDAARSKTTTRARQRKISQCIPEYIIDIISTQNKNRDFYYLCTRIF